MCEVSIILPAYNSEKYIEKTIFSILNQTYENFELIIIDDNSTDNTFEICQKIQKRDKRIKLIKNIGKGVSIARNTGIKESKGKYLMFIDSDDIYEKKIIEKMLNGIEGNDIAICNYSKLINDKIITNYVRVKDNIKRKDEMISFLHKNNLLNAVWNKIYVKDIIIKSNLYFDVELSIAEDLEFNLKYFNNIKKIKYLDKCLYFYRISNSGLNYSFHKDRIVIRKKIYDYEKEIFIENDYNLKLIFDEYLKICFAELRQIEYSTKRISEILIDKSRKIELKYIIKNGKLKQKIIAFCMNKKCFLTLIILCMKILKV